MGNKIFYHFRNQKNKNELEDFITIRHLGKNLNL